MALHLATLRLKSVETSDHQRPTCRWEKSHVMKIAPQGPLRKV
jgi:hypothetical protein